MSRPDQPEPFLRGCAFPSVPGVPYPRAKADDRLPRDTWTMASIPVGVRFEFVGDADQVEIIYETATDELGYRGDGAGRTFSLWRGDELVSEAPAVLGTGTLRLEAGSGDQPAIMYLPEGMRPTVTQITGVGGTIEPAHKQPRWVAYGDSVAEGWVASAPALAWPAIVGRRHGLDVVNMGYAGAARGEIVSAEHVAAVECDVISISHGTNCWTRVPFNEEVMVTTVNAFIDVIRSAQPQTPIVVVTPIVRPDAEDTPNILGADLLDLRNAMQLGAERAGGVQIIGGRELVTPEQLADGIHPNDDGHRALADALGPVIAGAG